VCSKTSSSSITKQPFCRIAVALGIDTPIEAAQTIARAPFQN
jgi:hypothetical protein